MRTSVVVLLSAVLGIVLGIGTTWAKLGRAPDMAADFDALTSNSRTPSRPIAPTGPQPRVVVDTEEHDFGTVERDHAVEHAFRFTDTGQAPLELKQGGTTCGKCTISRIPQSAILPGESADVVVQYNASIDKPVFRQSATILTNDPRSPRVVLTVTGSVASSYEVTPRQLVFSNLTANKAESAQLKVISFLSDTFAISSHEFVEPDTARYFDVRIDPIEPDKLTEPQAKCGSIVSITIKPGLPLGSLRQTLVLNTDLPGAAKLEIPIEGTVTSDITIAGQGWNRENGVLVLGIVRSSQGVQRNLLVLVHGEHRHDVKISVSERDPNFLQCKLGEPTEVNGGAVIRIPLTIEIPPGSPPANHLGSPGKLGRIMLETTHPDASQIRIYVQFAVEN